MNTELYTIKHFNNTLDLYASKQKLFSSGWFMDFGKLGSELLDSEGTIIFSITKKFKFWKWKMVYTIKNSKGNLVELISKNNRKTIYSIEVNGSTFEIKINYKKKTSVYKNGEKIAEFDESIFDEDGYNNINLQVLDKKDVEISFLLFSCLKIGETEQNQKAILTSQKELEINEDPWF